MVRKNIFANLIARAWGFVSIYLFVPLYLKFLGIDAYGLVGFYSTLLGVLAFADMGFTATLNREMARLSVRDDSRGEMRDLLRTYEATYLYISAALAMLVWFLSPLIAAKWLHSKVLQPDEMVGAIRLMGISLALELPSGLYIGGLMGLQRQVQANAIQIAWGVFRGVGAVVVLWLVSPTIFAFACWQLISNGIYCLAARTNLWRALSEADSSRPRFKWQVFRDTWRYATGMAGMAVVMTLSTQTDKLVVSKMLSLEMLGYYTLAGTLSMVPSMLASPIATAIFPRLTGLVALEDKAGLSPLYHQACELVFVAIIPAGLTIAFFATDFIMAWTGSALIAHQAGTVASLLVVGQLMQAAMIVPYYLALAHGNVRLNLQVGAVSIVLITPLLIFLIVHYGLVGAGVSWLLVNCCVLPPYMYFLHRRFLPGELGRWYLLDLGRPLLVALPCVLLGRWLLPHTDSRWLTFNSIGLVWAISTLVAIAAIPALRTMLITKICGILGLPYATR